MLLQQQQQQQHQQAPQQAPQHAPQPQATSLYIKNLPPEADKLFLYERFAPHGGIASVKVGALCCAAPDVRLRVCCQGTGGSSSCLSWMVGLVSAALCTEPGGQGCDALPCR